MEYSPAPTWAWDWVISVFGYGVLAYFIFVAIRDITQRGVSPHNVVIVILTPAASIPLAIFEFSWVSHEFLEPSPVFYVCDSSMHLLR